VASASSSSEPEPAPRHRAANAQRRARLDELAEDKRQLNEELALLHQELGWTQSLAIDNLHRTLLCRSSSVRGMASAGSATRLPNNHGPARRCHQPVDEHATTTDAPTRALTSTPMSTPTPTPTPTLKPHHSSSGRRRTSPRQQCCCAAARRWRPPRSDVCASN
jgi:hypothetical protein